MQAKIWLVRHGETTWSKTGQHTGRTDIPLTEEGRVIAARLASALAGRSFAHVLSSPLRRARETCELAGLGASMQLRDGLMEWDYGEFEGKTTPEILAKTPTWSLWRDGAPGGESPEAIGKRVDGVVDELARLAFQEPRGGDVAVFAHGHVLRVLAARWLGLPVDGGRLLALATATISKLGYERTERVLHLWNSDSHLSDPEGP
jgi:broad specificity phosphatase PhoE